MKRRAVTREHDPGIRGTAQQQSLGSAAGAATPRRVVIANEERRNRLPSLVNALSVLGHEAIVCELSATEAGSVRDGMRPDVVFVGRQGGQERALALIAALVRQGFCAVIALLSRRDEGYVRAAAQSGAFAYAVDPDAEELQAAIDIAYERFSQYHGLQGAFGRRAVVEQAKGILMAQHGIQQDAAFDLLRVHARRSSRKVVDVAEAIVASYQLLVPAADKPDQLDELDRVAD